MAPEYLAHGQLTEMVDVYSFGVLVLEIVTGKQNTKSKMSDYSDSLMTEVSYLIFSYVTRNSQRDFTSHTNCGVMFFAKKIGMEAFSDRRFRGSI